ncbi:N-acetyl-glucosamine transferase [Virgisporangium aliadipatigenens]|uniref:N-acetyl-glucosamine transferase n=1 Tax=Virgisporangium aliadipatigenens TaxID=741659 RepID=A0A8J3YRE2_9ACTN|nr:glycosyltransferase family 2 protein [Virgisporangium aliadipatigenens]GIJ50464.1 N-acetyl-glucosamine transferase [Virgisporangium aliadipatigenens]
MTLIIVGSLLLVAWPMYTLALLAFSVRNGAQARRHRVRVDSAAPVAGQPDTFWIVVPCLNEERVVGRTVAAALDLNGPWGSASHVLVVDDGSDDGTPTVLASIDHPNLHVLRRNLPEARKGKGEALNAAYRYIGSWTVENGIDPAKVAVGVIDGDGRGSRNLLMEVAHAMRDPKVGAVQSRVRIHNRNRLLAAVQDLEFGCIADASQSMRDSLSTVGLGGNGQFARLSALQKLGDAPWSACLVEDLELGLRLHLEGVRMRYMPQAAVTQQGLVDVNRLLRQRTRWAQGNLQCARYVPKLMASRRIGNGQLFEMLYYLLAPWLNAIGTIVMAGVWGYALTLLIAGDGETFMIDSWGEFAAAAAVWIAAMFAPGLGWAVLHRLKLRDEKLSRLLLAGLAYPIFLFLGLVSTWRAIGRHVARRQTWAKTERLAEEPVPA